METIGLTMEEIKVCPFCGSAGDIWKRLVWCRGGDIIREENRVMVVVTESVLEEPRWVADCSECDCVIGENFKSMEEAIAAWNRRV